MVGIIKKMKNRNLICLCIFLILLVTFLFSCNKNNKDLVKKITIGDTYAFVNKTNRDNISKIREIKDISHIPSFDETIETNTILGSIKLGKYEQDNNTENGMEDIEWIVIDNDKENKNKYLLVSRYILDYKKFDNGDKKLENYSKSDIRYFLNSYFYKKAFNESEKKLILDTKISDPEYVLNNNDTVNSSQNKFIYYDKIFLCNDISFPSFKDKSHTFATQYAKSKRIYVYDENVDKLNKSEWYNRIPNGISPFYFRMWDTSGARYGTDIKTEINIASGIRPAMWVDFSSDEEKQKEINSIVIYDDIRDLICQKQNLVRFGKNNLLWLVCKKEDGKALLRLYIPIDGERFSGESYNFYWPDSKVREYLNNDFYNNSFSNKDKEIILDTELLSSKYSYLKNDYEYKNTNDKVFLMNNYENKAFDYIEFVGDYNYLASYYVEDDGNEVITIHLRRDGYKDQLAVYENDESKVKELYLLPMIWVKMYDEK